MYELRKNNEAMNEEIQILIQPVLDHFELNVKSIVEQGRTTPVKDCRHLCIYAVKFHNPDLTLREIAQMFGGRNHATIIHSIEEAENIMFRKKKIKELMQSLKQPKKRRLVLPDERVWFNHVHFA